MIFFELYRQLDIRVFQTISAIDPGYGSCAKYVFDNDSLILLGMDHSIRLDILTREVKKDSPIKNWDIENETVMWFAEDSAEAVLIRLINDAYRKWLQLDANISDEYFAMELEQVNQILAGYSLRIFADASGMSIFKDDAEGNDFSFEKAIELIMDVDENRMDDEGISRLISEALYYRKLDRYEDATVRLEKVIRYIDHTLPIYTQAMFTLAETYYYMGNYDRAVMLYYRVNLQFIEDEDDFYLHLGHALVDAKMKKYDRHLRTYFHSRVDREFADTHRQAVAAAKASVSDVFEEYEKTCLDMGRKKYAEFRQSLPDGADEIDELLEEYEKPVEEHVKEIHRQYEGFKLSQPHVKAEQSTLSLNERLSVALDHYLTGEYQKSFDMYYRLAAQADEDSDFYTWIYLQLGKLYCFFDEPAKAWNALQKCDPQRFGVVYRLEDFLILYQHTHIVAEDFESDERFRKLIRGSMDPYYAQYDRLYNNLLKDRKLMRAYRTYEKDCLEDSKFELRNVLRDNKERRGGLFGLFKRGSQSGDD